MKRHIFSIVTALFMGAAAILPSTIFAAVPVKITKFQLTVPAKWYVAYDGPSKQLFPHGFRTGFGSGIALKSVNKDGSIELYGLTDRGPNGDGPDYTDNLFTFSSKFFPSAAFQPEIGVIKLKNAQAEVTKTIGLKTRQDKAITGLPIPPGLVGATNEIAVNEVFRNLGYDENGLDPEGIALDANGNFWICDEYGPFIAQFSKGGELIKKYAPGNGLPEILKWRIPNRGFEGLSVSPGGEVFAAVQSPLDIDGQSVKTAPFTRIVRLDPVTGQTKMYAYPIDVDAYKSPKGAKIGDIYAISDTKLLLIEQGTGKDKQMRNLIYLVDLTNATDLTGYQVNGKEPEFFTKPNLPSTLQFAEKKLILDLKQCGWEPEKAEGLLLLPDKKTLVVTNDNDFAMQMQVIDSENKNTDPTDYTYHAANGSFTRKGQSVYPVMRVIPSSEAEQHQQIWLIELPETVE